MSMEQAIRDFPRQFEWEPVVENAERLPAVNKYVVAGLGGSHLSAGLLKVVRPELDLLIHRDYGLPRVPDYFLKESLIIASSYSGNTAETVSAFKAAAQAGLQVAAIATGGELLAAAEGQGAPYVQLPPADLQPRSALGYSLLALLALLGETELRQAVQAAGRALKPEELRPAGEALAERLRGLVPVIYAGTVNLPLAYNWKIKLNETGKVPAFWNVLPELNHNEMAGFDVAPEARALTDRFGFVFLRDEAEDPRLAERFRVLEKLYTDRGLPVEIVTLAGRDPWEKIFASLLLADWTAYYTALGYGAEPERVPIIEEFKKLIG